MQELEEAMHLGSDCEAARSAFSKECNVSSPQMSSIFQNLFFITLHIISPWGLSPCPHLRGVLSGDVPTNIPGNTAAVMQDVDSSGQADVLFLNTFP